MHDNYNPRGFLGYVEPPRKSFMERYAGTLLVALSLMVAAVVIYAAPAQAQFAAVPRQDNTRSFGYVTGGPALGYTNATTSYTQVTGATVNNATVNDPGQLSFQNSSTYEAETLRVTWSVDAIKATATTGTCGVYLNGSLVTRSPRVLGSTANGNIGGYLELSKQNGDNVNTGSGTETQTVALYCKSGDTNTFTVNAFVLNVQEVY